MRLLHPRLHLFGYILCIFSNGRQIVATGQIWSSNKNIWPTNEDEVVVVCYQSYTVFGCTPITLLAHRPYRNKTHLSLFSHISAHVHKKNL